MSASDPKREIVAARLRAAREMAGLSQGQVANLVGMHRPTVSEIEAGRRRVAVEELLKFAGIYDVTLSWLAGEQVEKLDPHGDLVELAARELRKLKPEDLDRLLGLLGSLRAQEQ